MKCIVVFIDQAEHDTIRSRGHQHHWLTVNVQLWSWETNIARFYKIGGPNSWIKFLGIKSETRDKLRDQKYNFTYLLILLIANFYLTIRFNGISYFNLQYSIPNWKKKKNSSTTITSLHIELHWRFWQITLQLPQSYEQDYLWNIANKL